MSWDESVPSDADLLSQGAGAIRTLKADVASGLSASMYWPGSGEGSAASAGVMKPGSFRAGYGVESAVSLGVDTGRLYVVGSGVPGNVYLLQPSVDSLQVLSGHAIEHPQSMASTARWVVSSGTVALGATATFPVTYLGIPRVGVSLYTAQDTPSFPIAVKLDAISATQFTPSGFSITEAGAWGAVTGEWVDYISIGSVAF